MDFIKDFQKNTIHQHIFDRWLLEYDLFLFDFDGLLVDTEPVHFQAYKKALEKFNLNLPWDYSTYCKHALFESLGLKKALLAHFTQLKEEDWEPLYENKKQSFLELTVKNVQLMPGVLEFLSILKTLNKSMVVVTNSPKEHIDQIKNQHPIFQTIDKWLTREDYTSPKPSPDGYLKAMEQKHKKAIGFEDSPKGIKALMQTKATPILINQNHAMAFAFAKANKIQMFTSLEVSD